MDRQKSAPSVPQELGVIISNQTVRCRLHEIGFYRPVTRKGPYMNKARRIKRLNDVKMYENKDMDFWEHILWSDGSKINLFGTDGRNMVWRALNEEFQPACTVPTVEHGIGNVKVSGCFAWNGVGNLMGHMYKDILENNLFQSAVKLNLGKNTVFQHDNDPKHTAHIVKNWFNKQRIERLNWPPFSPYMNPIEHLWDEAERRMKKHQPKNEDQLRRILQAEWEGIGQDVTKSQFRIVYTSVIV